MSNEPVAQTVASFPSCTQGKLVRLRADVSLAIVHALGLLCAHALYWLRMHGENRQHSIRTGPAGTVIGAGHQIHSTIFWAITQVGFKV